ncbi:hypothetical protein IE53DRAFT_363961 [Violaceomyces palustris]|uniref:Uncharacterized protein n=1 Tax=Violaceomyces palustris TaxID=1673888 RepID=A0ACD0NR89_9BASI|nr:hypothetical protein IE53DRAFT_363961 [Violaceomyces palustris]
MRQVLGSLIWISLLGVALNVHNDIPIAVWMNRTFDWYPSIVQRDSPSPYGQTYVNQSDNSLPVGRCTPTVPCSEEACCSGEWCGFGPEYCGETCTSKCDRLAECGPYASPGHEHCPLNVCCSKYGYCGTSEEFCGEGCQSGCNIPGHPTCSQSQATALRRRIGYYASWASSGPCGFPPESLDVSILTHVNFAFASIDGDGNVVPQDGDGDMALWKRVVALKQKNPALEVWLSIGGWSFNDPGPSFNYFSNLAASESMQSNFISSAVNVMQTYGFDGIDIDWEYPGAPERGGNENDRTNFANMMARTYQAFKSASRPYGLTWTAPSSYWYLRHFDIPSLLQSSDWVNVMTYDLHGTWDASDPYIGPFVLAHTNLTEIQQTVDLFSRVGADLAKVVLGIGFYGRSFHLTDPSCSDPGCSFSDGGATVGCSTESGEIRYADIMQILAGSSSEPIYDPGAEVMYTTYNDGNDWVSYDNAATFQKKVEYANSNCLGGTMIWSIDEDTPTFDALVGLYPTVSGSFTGDVHRGPEGCRTMACGVDTCPVGFTKVGSTYLSEEFKDSCRTNPNPAAICCPTTTAPTDCYWTNEIAFERCAGSCRIGEVACMDDPTTGGSYKELCCKSSFNYKNCEWVGQGPHCLGDNACPRGKVSIAIDVAGDKPNDFCIDGYKNYCCDPPAGTESDVPAQWVFSESVQGATETLEMEPLSSESMDVTMQEPSTWDPESPETDAFGEVFISSPNSNAVSNIALYSDWKVVGCQGDTHEPQEVTMYCSKEMTAEDSGCSHVFLGEAEHTVVRLSSECGGHYARISSLTEHPDGDDALPSEHKALKPKGEKVYKLSFDYNFATIPESNGPIYMRADASDIRGYWDDIVDSPQKRDIERLRGSILHKRSFHDDPTHPLNRRWFGNFGQWLSRVTQRVTTVSTSSRDSINFGYYDQWNLFHAEQQCPLAGGGYYRSSFDVDVEAGAHFDALYGFYFEGSVVPPSVKDAYVYTKASGSVSLQLSIDVNAHASWGADPKELIRSTFPGLSAPGLISIGPSFAVYGQLEGSLQANGNLKTGVAFDFGDYGIQLGYEGGSFTNGGDIGAGLQPSGKAQGLSSNFGASLTANGEIKAHIIPSTEFGLNVLGGSIMDARIYVRADAYAGLTLSADSGSSACSTPDYGVALKAGVTGGVPVFGSGGSGYETSFATFPMAGTSSCVSYHQRRGLKLGSEEMESDGGYGSTNLVRNVSIPPRTLGSFADQALELATIAQREKSPISAVALGSLRGAALPSPPPVKGAENRALESPLVNQDPNGSASSTLPLRKRLSVPRLPGSLFCPTVEEQDDSDSSLCSVYGGDSYLERRSELYDGDEEEMMAEVHALAFEGIERDSEDDHQDWDLASLVGLFEDGPQKRAPSSSCLSSYTVPKLPYSSVPISSYWDLSAPSGSNGGIYAREHIYETQFVSRFIQEELEGIEDLWKGARVDGDGEEVRDICEWADEWIKGGALLETLARCQPCNGIYGCGQNQMPALERMANLFKGIYFGGKNIRQSEILISFLFFIRRQRQFKDLCASAQIGRIRSMAGLLDYMRSNEVRDQFLAVHGCLRGRWQDFVTTYSRQQGSAPNAGQVDIAEELDAFAFDALDRMAGWIRDQIEIMISLYQPGRSSIRSYNAVIDSLTVFDGKKQAPKSQRSTITAAGLRRSILNRLSDDIPWKNRVRM